MNIDNILRTIAILAAVVLILSNVNFEYIYQFLLQRFQSKTNNFIEIVNLWHILREKCNKANLKDAVVKLDETFPLLNNEEDNV
ncbi:MAG: hypothetical protein EBU90_13395 [Proteobacteria bacterium]|nr:hypothetical protein [Pseudomonadota bacterium]NBP15106.1 hypothetical protein [bacterium]